MKTRRRRRTFVSTMMAEMMLASWETMTRRAMLMAQNQCSPAEYRRCSAKKSRRRLCQHRNSCPEAAERGRPPSWPRGTDAWSPTQSAYAKSSGASADFRSEITFSGHEISATVYANGRQRRRTRHGSMLDAAKPSAVSDGSAVTSAVVDSQPPPWLVLGDCSALTSLKTSSGRAPRSGCQFL